jgi:hypothetical protein
MRRSAVMQPALGWAYFRDEQHDIGVIRACYNFIC